MLRRFARVTAIEALYQAESYQAGCCNREKDLEAICNEALLRNDIVNEQQRQFVRELIRGTWEHRHEYDEAISGRSKGWPLHRMGRVEVAIMRMALHEIRRMDTPRSVVINEAVELAKEYASGRAAAFINGILGSLVAET